MYWPEEFICQWIFSEFIFYLFILFMWFSRQECWNGLPFPSCSGPHFVRTLCHDPSVLGGPARRGSYMGHAQSVFPPVFCWWMCLCSLPAVWPEVRLWYRDCVSGRLLQKAFGQHAAAPGTVWPVALAVSPHVCGDSWALTGKSDSVSCGVTAPFSWVLVRTRFCLCPRFCLPCPVEALYSNPTGLQSQIPWGFSVPLPDPHVGKSAGP